MESTAPKAEAATEKVDSSEAQQANTTKSQSPAAPEDLHKSSSSSSLLLPENKKDSPTKASRMKRSASSGAIAKSKSAENIAVKAPANVEAAAKDQQDKGPSADAATILESLATAEKEQLSKSNPNSPARVEHQSTTMSAVRVSSEETPSNEKLALKDTAIAPIVSPRDTTPSRQKKVLKIPENKKDSPRTPDGERRVPRRPSPPNLTGRDVSVERLERIATSPVSVDSLDASEAKEWLTEPTTAAAAVVEPLQETKVETVVKEKPPQDKVETDAKEEPPQALSSQKEEPPVIMSPRRITSLQWHEVPNTSSRVIEVPQEEPKQGLLPSPPSFRRPQQTEEVVAVFNANTAEGKSMVRALAKRGSQVIAIVRVFTSRNTKSLLKLGKNVVVKVADSHDEAALAKAVQGADRAFLVTTYWERFDSSFEEKQAFTILNACASQNVGHLVFHSFEDTRRLREKNLKSQIVPRKDGTITPTFGGMMALKEAAKKRNVQLTHMITSYLDQEHSKKSLCLIVGENGKLLINSHFPEED